MNKTILIDKIDTSCRKYKKVQATGIPKFVKLDEWLEKESNIFENETKPRKRNYPKFKRGQIIKVDFGINIGTELSHTHFAIVLNNDDTINNDNLTVIPITSKKGYKRIPLGKILQKAIPQTEKYNLNCYAILTQITTISKRRIFKTNFKYICEYDILTTIDENIKKYLTKEFDNKTKL